MDEPNPPPPTHQIMNKFNVPESHILPGYQVALLTYLHRVLILYVGLKFIAWSLTSTLTIIIFLKAKHSITARVL